ncbi:MAG: hypothetical protein DRR19_24515 [Candidatus Parabeggiatoa sp. nov. 1]|nr:MAG: hypothetical protein DRR19_24515 [Gammaproteobacteria bacterium]
MPNLEGLAQNFSEQLYQYNIKLLCTGPKSVQVVMLSLVFAIVSLKKNHPVGYRCLFKSWDYLIRKSDTIAKTFAKVILSPKPLPK